MSTAITKAQRTALYDCHKEAGAKFVEFAGWDMPVQYAGLMDEHRAVRSAAGLFDVSHMGELHVSGPDAEAFLQRLTPNDVGKLKAGRAHYSALLNERGTYLDDILIYRLDEAEFLVVVNAANVDKDFDWVREQANDYVTSGGNVTVVNVSDQWALLALQGPATVEILSQLTDLDLDSIRYYRFATGSVDGVEGIVSRTGYTGEDGFELYLPPAGAAQVWRALMAAGEPHGLLPAGLGARDSLRLEASMALYGHEIDDTTTPWEAALDWTVKLAKGDFIGRQALVQQREAGVRRKLIGFEVEGRGIAREGHAVLRDDQPVGKVTSGTFSPTFEKALGLAYVPVEMAEPGSELTLQVRSRQLPARVVETPFYKRAK